MNSPSLLYSVASAALICWGLLSSVSAAELREIVWVDDDFPPGAVTQVNADTHPQTWVTKSDGAPVFAGKRALRRSGPGVAQDFFESCDEPLVVCEGDKLFAYVHLSAEKPARAVMLQYFVGGWNHRAIWGDAEAIPYGTAGTTQKVEMGPLPKAGQWVRLEIATAKLAHAPGTEITGMAFTICDGEVFFDKAGLATSAKEPPAGEARDTVWVDDDFPAGSAAQVAGDPVQWVTATEGKVFFGQRALKRSGGSGPPVQDFFTDAAPPLEVRRGDILYAHVFIDPADKPKAIMLQFNNGTWDHRAYWGETTSLEWGVPNTASRRQLGSLPEAGKWIRLEVPALKVGLGSGAKLNGMAFTQEGGTVYWDKAGVFNPGPTGK